LGGGFYYIESGGVEKWGKLHSYAGISSRGDESRPMAGGGGRESCLVGGSFLIGPGGVRIASVLPRDKCAENTRVVL